MITPDEMDPHVLSLFILFHSLQSPSMVNTRDYFRKKIIATPIHEASGLTGFTMTVQNIPTQGVLFCYVNSELHDWIGFYCNAEKRESKLLFDTTNSRQTDQSIRDYEMIFSFLHSENCLLRHPQRYYMNARWTQPLEIEARRKTTT